jgi:hypothetical protein
MALPIHCVDGNDARPTATAGHGRGLLNEKQAADLLTVKLGTLRRWRWAGKGPRFVKLGSAVRYDLVDLDGFIAAGRRTSTSDLGAALSGREAA